MPIDIFLRFQSAAQQKLCSFFLGSIAFGLKGSPRVDRKFLFTRFWLMGFNALKMLSKQLAPTAKKTINRSIDEGTN